MRAIILAAGQGKRMDIDKPKCLIKFGGSTLLDHQIAMFRDFGIDKITIVAGYMADKIHADVCEKIVNEEYDSTNMVYSLFLAEDIFVDDILVSYGDIIYEKRILKKVLNSKKDINVVVDINGVEYFKNRLGAYYKLSLESLSLGRTGKILDIGKKWRRIDENSYDGQYIGLMRFSHVGWDVLSKTYYANLDQYRKACMTDILSNMIKHGQSVYAVKSRGGWLEFDTQGDICMYEKWLKNGRLKKYYRGNIT